MTERLEPAAAAARVRGDRHARPAPRPRAAAELPRGARRTRRLGGPAGLRRAARGRHRALHARERPPALGLLRAVRAGDPRRGRQHRLRTGRLPALRPVVRARAAAGDVHGGLGPRRRRLLLPLPPRRRLPARDHAGERGPRPPACRRGGERLSADRRAAPRAPAPDPRRSGRHPDRDGRKAARAPLGRAERDRPRDRRERGRVHRVRLHRADGHRRRSKRNRRDPRRGRRRRPRHPLGDVHRRPDAPARGRRGLESQGKARSTGCR